MKNYEIEDLIIQKKRFKKNRIKMVSGKVKKEK